MSRDLALDFVRIQGELLTLEELGWYSRHNGLKDAERKALATGLAQVFGSPKPVRLETILGTVETKAYFNACFRADVFQSLGLSDDIPTTQIAFTRK